MIAMLQQFYMTPMFRYAILMANDGLEENIVSNEKYGVTNMDDNIFHQTQMMFGFLDITDRQSFDPTPFCFSFKDWDKNPVNVLLQQDT